eukprot:gene25045-biopygen20942
MHGNLCFRDFRPKRVAPPPFINLPLAGYAVERKPFTASKAPPDQRARNGRRASAAPSAQAGDGNRTKEYTEQ